MAKKKSSNNYFTKETEQSIVRYNNSTDEKERAKIFTDHIYYPFYKLAENNIHSYKFYYTDVDDIEDLKLEIVSVLLEEKIMKFDPSNGAKAFSYFNTIVKRWLISYNEKNYRRLKKFGSFDDVEESYEGSIDPTLPGTISLVQFLDLWVEKTYDNLDEMFPKEREKVIADAILTIFKKRNDINIFKKKALYIYIREMTDCKTPHLTKVVSKLKDDFYPLYLKYVELGKIKIKLD